MNKRTSSNSASRNKKEKRVGVKAGRGKGQSAPKTEKVSDRQLKFFKPELSDVCSAKPTVEVLDGTFYPDSFFTLANYIVLKANERLGTYPFAGDAFCPGAVALYLGKLYAAYQVMCGVNTFDVSSYTGFETYCIPGFVGVLFHTSVRVVDRHTSGSFTLRDPAYDTILRAVSITEGNALCPVVVGGSPDELIFGNGGAIIYSSVGFTQCELISRIIASAFDHVVKVCDIATSTGSYGSLCGTDTSSIKPISRPASLLTIVRSNDSLFPCTELSNSTPWSSGAFELITGLLWLFEDLEYRPTSTINSMCRSRGVDPFKYTAIARPCSYAMFTEYCITLLKRNGNLIIGQSGVSCWNLLANFAPYVFSGFAAQMSWVSRTNCLRNQVPTYITSAMKSIKLTPGVIANGCHPVLVHSALIIPVWVTALNSQFCCRFQRLDVVSANLNPVNFLSVLASGTIPNTFVFAGSTPLPRGSLYNQFPLRVLDNLENWVLSNTNAYRDQMTRLPKSVAICPCLANHAQSGDTYPVNTSPGNEFIWSWMTMPNMYAATPMSQYNCSCAVGSGFMAGFGWSRFYKYSSSTSGEMMLPLVEAGFRDSAYENFAAANQGKNPAESYMRYFRDRVLDGVTTVAKNIKPSDLRPLVEALNDTGFMPVEVNPEIFNNLSGEYNLNWLTHATAAAVGRYGPTIWNYLNRNRLIRVRAEL